MKKTTVKRRDYERPAAEILELRPQQQVLAASTDGFDDGGTLPGWGKSGTGTSDFGDGGGLPGWN